MLQTVVPDKFRGRVFSFEFAALTATQSISTLAAGYLVDSVGLSPQGAVGVSAATAVGVTLLWLVFYLAYRRPLLTGVPLRVAPEVEATD
jgi:hypothetical protein